MSEVSFDSADGLLIGIRSAMVPVATFPRLGRMLPEFGSEALREIIFQSYRIVYSVVTDTIFVLAVLHAAMDVAARCASLG